MMIPTVHSNGTSKQNLQQELLDAANAIAKAIEALRQVTVHGRDYYVQGPSAYAQAREEMDRRFAALSQIAEDLNVMYNAIEEQGR